MGTDRVEAYHDQCLCGSGEVIINFCTPDHPWPTSSKWFETSVSCSDCLDKYALIEQDNKYVFVDKNHLKIRDDYGAEYSQRSDDILKWPEVKEILDNLTNILEAQPSIAACYRLLNANGLIVYGTVGTFRRHWSGASNYVRNNVRASSLNNIMKLTGKIVKKVETEVGELEILWEKHNESIPIVGQPLLDISPYMW